MASVQSRRTLVVGSGVIGLATAKQLLKCGVSVILRSYLPPLHTSTCSLSGGFWMPFRCDDDRVENWAKETLDVLLPIAHKNRDKSSHGDSLVEIVPALILQKENHVYPEDKLPQWSKDPRLNFQALNLDMLFWQNEIHKLRIPKKENLQSAGYSFSWLYNAPVVDTPKMLMKMYEDVVTHPLTENVNVGVKFNSIDKMVEEAVKNNCDSVVNCTGLGSRKVVNDSSLTGGRGILHYYDRSTCKRDVLTPLFDGSQPCRDAVITCDLSPWGSYTNPCYMIPRGDSLVIGGTYLEGDDYSNIREEEHEMLKKNAATLGIDTLASKPIGEWVGFRPARKTVRVEIDQNIKEINFVHNYGHGGSGWTVFAGAAREAANLITSSK